MSFQVGEDRTVLALARAIESQRSNFRVNANCFRTTPT